MSFVKLPIPLEGEKLFTFEHAEDGKSFTMIDEKGVKLQVFLDKGRQIQSIVMPDGKKVVYNRKNLSENQTARNIKLECDNVFLDNMAAPGGDVCRDAAVAAVIGIGVCAATGGLSTACWAATATAAYLAYKCHEASQ